MKNKKRAIKAIIYSILFTGFIASCIVTLDYITEHYPEMMDYIIYGGLATMGTAFIAYILYQIVD